MTIQLKAYSLYNKLLEKYGDPSNLWPQWCERNKEEHLRQLVAIGAILVQRTSWVNAEKALENIKKENLLSVDKLVGTDLNKITKLIRVAGFYTTKPRRLQELCRFVKQKYGSFTQMLEVEEKILRGELLKVYGIGPETADTLLLYALDKPSFIIDTYTRKFVEKYNLSKKEKYLELKDFFESTLPKDIEIFQNYHILMIVDQKGKKYCTMKKI